MKRSLPQSDNTLTLTSKVDAEISASPIFTAKMLTGR
jgi:hypothetical protein